MTLSLTDMANRVQLADAAEAEKYVLYMVSNDEQVMVFFWYITGLCPCYMM